MADEFCLKMPDFHVTVRDLLHPINLRHGTNGFTSFPKEGLLKIFSPWKIRRLRPGLNPRTWVPKASALTLDHRSGLVPLLFYLSITNLSMNIIYFNSPFCLHSILINFTWFTYERIIISLNITFFLVCNVDCSITLCGKNRISEQFLLKF